MKPVLSCLFMLLIVQGFSQNRLLGKGLTNRSDPQRKAYLDSLLKKGINDGNIGKMQALKNQPSVVVLENKAAYKMNNGRGSDIYIMMHDNMPCVVPDSTFHSTPKGENLLQSKKYLVLH